MRAFLGLGVVVGLLGCKPFEPEGLYVGTETITSDFSAAAAEGAAAEGKVTAASSKGTTEDTSLQFRRTGEGTLEITIHKDCVIPLEQSPAPNEHDAKVASTAPPCFVREDPYEGNVVVSGTASFSRDAPTVRLAIIGAVPEAGSQAWSGQWGYAFEGTKTP